MTQPTKVLVLGATGMLGHVVLHVFAEDRRFDAVGTVRSAQSLRQLPAPLRDKTVCDVNVDDFDGVIRAVGVVKPRIVVNCVGIVKQLDASNDPLVAVPVNTLLPHRLARLCAAIDARLIHVSTDCVFAGTRGMYVEGDAPDADDLYGRTKLLGEVDYANAVTLRTSMIGHELGTRRGLVEWFLSQERPVSGYRHAVFSGLTTRELARIMRDFVVPRPELRGVYHVAATPIAKLDLLRLIATEYGRPTTITPDDSVRVDRSLNADRFHAATGYVPPDWPDLIHQMRISHAASTAR